MSYQNVADRFSFDFDTAFCVKCREYVVPELHDEDGKELEAPSCPFCFAEVTDYGSLVDAACDLASEMQ